MEIHALTARLMDDLIITALLQIDYILARLVSIGRAALVIVVLVVLCVCSWVLTMRYKEGD